MRLIPVDQCQPGMRLGRNIYNDEGLVLLAEQAELTGPLIRKLEQHGIARLYIRDARTDDITLPELITEETRQRALAEIRTHFRRLMLETAPRRAINAPFIGKAFKDVAALLLEDLRRHESAMLLLAEMSLTDQSLYQHSLNVGLHTLLLGLAQGYDQEELLTIGLGALLHDIGKTQLPPSLLYKPDPIAEEERLLRSHTDLGFRLLKDEPNIPLLAAHCALQHHERRDGTGYPRGLRGDDIHVYAEWIGIVDAYEAMTSVTGTGTRPLLPHQAIEQLFVDSGSLFDASKIELFRDRIALYPIGLQVKLSSGEAGVVVDLNSRSSLRPVVRILYGAEGEELTGPYEIDLSKRLNLMITAVHPFD